MTKLDALFVFCFWVAVGSAFAVLFSRIAKLNDQPDEDPADDDSRLAEVAHFDCERRRRGDVRMEPAVAGAQLDLGHAHTAGRGRPSRAQKDEREARALLTPRTGLVAVSTVRPPLADRSRKRQP